MDQASASRPSAGARTGKRPQVLLIFLTRDEDSALILQGVSHFERSHQPWAAFLDDEARAQKDHRWLRSKAWDGVICRHTTPELVHSCADLGIPLVDLNDCAPVPGTPKIRPDNIAIGHLGAEHFLERGFHHFGFVGFSNTSWSAERRHGFVEALRLAGRTCDVFEVEWPGDLTPTWDEEQTAMLANWLRDLPKPVALMSCNDLRALQVIAAAHAAGLLVPEETAILGANNDAIRCDLAYPPLSSVATNPFQLGYAAAECLARLMEGESAPHVDLRIEPGGVVTRHSTDVLAINDRNVAAALGYIREHACRGTSVDDVLKHAAASRSQLEKKFRRYLGRSPQSEIRRVQIARIKQLLVETDFPLKKIADLAGFEHVEYLSVVFKRFTNETPGGYRKKRQSPINGNS